MRLAPKLRQTAATTFGSHGVPHITDKMAAQRLLVCCAACDLHYRPRRAKITPNYGCVIWLPRRATHYGQNGRPTITTKLGAMHVLCINRFGLRLATTM
jgi:hypothetical protein